MRSLSKEAVFCLISLACVILNGCGGDSVPNQPAAISVSLSPSSATVLIGGSQQFAATISNTPDQSVTWSVNGTPGGNATTGTISSSGLYTPPATVPSTSITVTATSHADSSKTGTAALSLLYPVSCAHDFHPLTILRINWGFLSAVDRQRRWILLRTRKLK